MNRILIFSAITLCLGSHLVHSQYQTAPAYGNGYQQQRKMAPAPQNYGQQQERMRGNSEGAMDNYSESGSQADYGSGATSSYRGKQQMSRAMGSGGYGSKGAGYGEAAEGRAEPFAFGYDINDGYGNTQYHKENGDEQGKVTGSYGYRDAYGVFRYVDYVADENGFRATVKTNEPGTANESPADVDWRAEEPPAQTNPGSKSSYGSNNNAGSSSSYNSAAGSYGSSADAGSSDMNQYASMSSGSMVGNGAGKYGAGGANGGAASSASSGSSYSGSGSSAMMMQSMDSQPQQYGGSAPMMNAITTGSSKKYNGANNGASAARAGAYAMGSNGANMMIMPGARQNAKSYGNGMGTNSGAMNGQSSYAGSSGMSAAMAAMMMGQANQAGYAGQGANGAYAMGSAGRSSMYKSSAAGGARRSSNGDSYESADSGSGSMMMMPGSGDQYGASSGNGDMSLQQQMQGADSAQSAYGSAMNSMMDDAQSDSALAQQYGPSAMSMQQAVPINNNQNNAQLYAGASSSSPMTDGASTYSSMRLQSPGSTSKTNRPRGYANGGQSMMNGSGYGSANNAQRAMGGQSSYAGPGAIKSAQSNGMDYKKAATKNIAALVKRY